MALGVSWALTYRPPTLTSSVKVLLNGAEVSFRGVGVGRRRPRLAVDSVLSVVSVDTVLSVGVGSIGVVTTSTAGRADSGTVGSSTEGSSAEGTSSERSSRVAVGTALEVLAQRSNTSSSSVCVA